MVDPHVQSPPVPGRLKALWFGLLGGPIMWVVQMGTKYTLVSWDCTSGRDWPQYAVTIAALVICAAAGLVALHEWNDAGKGLPDDSYGLTPQIRFLAILGISVSALFFLLITAQGIATLMIGPCQ